MDCVRIKPASSLVVSLDEALTGLSLGGGATWPLPRNESAEELRGDPSAGHALRSRPEITNWKK